MYLVDTNVISEARKGRRANPGVLQFFRSTIPADRFLSVQTVGEIRRGIENIRRRGGQDQASRLEVWLDAVISEYANRILSFDSDCAQVWGRLMSPQASSPIDKQIAAIALIHGLVVVTRNIDDFSATSANLLNPFA
ncbi:MAG TPA: type II toxin-antitoxin system VapC family toxin [Telluria sp.]